MNLPDPKYIQDYLNAARFYYRHGFNERLAYNLEQLASMMDLLTAIECGEWHFLNAMSLLKKLRLPEAFSELDSVQHSFLPKYVTKIKKYLSLRQDIRHEQVSEKLFTLSRSHRDFVAKVFLQKAGVIEGSNHPNETHWSVTSGCLAFSDSRGEITTLFMTTDNNLGYSGPFLMRPIVHKLLEIKHAP